MKTEIVFNPPGWCWDENNNAHNILNQKRGQNRRMTHGLIVIETLRAISGGKPTRDQLQKEFVQALMHDHTLNEELRVVIREALQQMYRENFTN